MRLCMFHPNDNPLERGWVGRLDGDRVLHLAAQTLQSFFLGGGGAREHAEYARADVTLLVPVQNPPTVRVFSTDGSFRFANASAVIGTGVPVAGKLLTARGRIAAVIGAEGAIGGYSGLLEWETRRSSRRQSSPTSVSCLGRPSSRRTRSSRPPSPVGSAPRAARQTAGPTPFSWPEAVELAARRTVLRPGDVVAGPPVAALDGITSGAQLEVEGIGTLDCPSSSRCALSSTGTGRSRSATPCTW